jgi:hypothetical protein
VVVCEAEERGPIASDVNKIYLFLGRTQFHGSRTYDDDVAALPCPHQGTIPDRNGSVKQSCDASNLLVLERHSPETNRGESIYAT